MGGQRRYAAEPIFAVAAPAQVRTERAAAREIKPATTDDHGGRTPREAADGPART